ncbi:MAG: hypothetical protein IKF51_04945 [Solobacterium sp.]|nr:hypothetical protein [Solobacterium sp.]
MLTNGVEMTTTVTDLINGILTIILIILLQKCCPESAHRKLWTGTLILFAAVSLYGVPIHGIRMSEQTKSLLWVFMYLLMSLMLASFVVTMHHDLLGHSRKTERAVLGITLVFCAVFVFLQLYGTKGRAFLVFGAYGALCALYILYMLIPRLKMHERNRWYLAGLVVFILATVLQSIKTIRFTLIWDFNYNGVYHALLAVFVLLMYRGITMPEEKD